MSLNLFSRVVQHVDVMRWAPRAWIRKQVTEPIGKLRSFGTAYARGTIVDDESLRGGLAVLCGAGEDISFDLELQRNYDCATLIVDPTPRAIAHVQDILAAGNQGLATKAFVINGVELNYDLLNINFKKMELVPYGIWNETTTLKFFAPKDPNHVSYSITNLQRTEKAIEMNVKTLDKIAQSPISILKLNIEGAEIEVLNWLSESEMRPKQILAVFDELHTPNRHSSERIRYAVRRLQDVGYCIVHYDGFGSCLFFYSITTSKQRQR